LECVVAVSLRARKPMQARLIVLALMDMVALSTALRVLVRPTAQPAVPRRATQATAVASWYDQGSRLVEAEPQAQVEGAPELLEDTLAPESEPQTEAEAEAPAVSSASMLAGQTVTTRLFNTYIANKEVAVEIDAMLVDAYALAVDLPGCVGSRRVFYEKEGGGLMYRWDAEFESTPALSEYMRSEARLATLMPVVDQAVAKYGVAAPPPPPPPPPPPAPPGFAPSTLPPPVAEKLSELDLSDPTTLPAAEQAEVLGAVATGTLLVFLLPGEPSNFFVDLVVSSLFGGGLLGYAALRQDVVGTKARGLGGKANEAAASALEAAQKSDLPDKIKDKLPPALKDLLP